MTNKEVLDKSLAHGAVAVVRFDDVLEPALEFTMADARWLDNPKRLRWCPIFPEHQGHIHETEYDEVINDYDRDLSFKLKGKQVLSICPYEESGLNSEDVVEALARWRALVGAYNNAENFREFFEET